MAHVYVNDLYLDYPVYGMQSTSIRNTVSHLLSAGQFRKEAKAFTVEALRGISFDLKSGDRLGLIGGNGAGKTTLLKILSGIFMPTRGEVECEGTISCLLGAGFGMDTEASGYENILIAGIALGATIKEMRARTYDIGEFTELGPFLGMPLRSYSSGMQARLAFAISISLAPDILLIDEGIAVEDAAFIDKAEISMKDFFKSDNILVLATHNNALIRKFCNKALYLESGETKYFGDVEEALRLYEKGGIAEPNKRTKESVAA